MAKNCTIFNRQYRVVGTASGRMPYGASIVTKGAAKQGRSQHAMWLPWTAFFFHSGLIVHYS